MRPFEKLLRYLANKECGASAKAIIYRLNDVQNLYISHPVDFYDFERCLKLLHEFPDYRLELHHMKDVSPEWALFIKHWDELENLFYVSGVTLNNRLNELLNSIPCSKCGKPLNQNYVRVDENRYHFDCRRGTKF